MDVLKTLLNLCSFESVSGKEKNLTNYLYKALEKYSKNIKTTNLNSIICEIKGKKNCKLNIMLEAHIDSIGFVVEDITKEGFLKIANCGGIDLKILNSQEVIVCGKKKLEGFIFKNVEDTKNAPKKIEDFLVDINLSKEEAEKLVSIGDIVAFKNISLMLKNDMVCTRFLDNKASVVCILKILEKLKGTDFNFNLYVVFSSLEETSQGGAITAANFLEKIDFAISIDVSFAKTLNCEEEPIGEILKGPLIGISPILDDDLTKKMIEIAKANKTPHQFEIMNSLTHTDADSIAISKSGVKTCLISIPLKNMHTPLEIVSLKDINSTIDLIFNFINSF